MKYKALRSYFAVQKQARLRLSFADVSRIAGTQLPSSAYEHAAWWANDSKSHTQARAWLEAGYKTENIDLDAQRVEFVRKDEGRSRVLEVQEAFDTQSKKVSVHPAFGALKGTFTIAPGWDLTRPAFDEEELAAWEASLDRKADLIEKGLRGER